MEIIVVLSHLMSKDGVLGDESIARANTAVKLCNERRCGLLITSGWAYRSDCVLAIGDVVADYIKNKFNLTACNVVSDTNSRDTVGDAFYLRRRLTGLNCSKLSVVTSDYHVRRASLIFETIFANSVLIEVIGTPTGLTNDSETLLHEMNSIKAFEDTFIDVDFRDEEQIFRAMSIHHPFYNGTVYPNISITL